MTLTYTTDIITRVGCNLLSSGLVDAAAVVPGDTRFVRGRFVSASFFANSHKFYPSRLVVPFEASPVAQFWMEQGETGSCLS